jgi:hypothetical protein
MRRSDKGRILNALANATGDTVPVGLDVSDGALTVALPERQDRTVYDLVEICRSASRFRVE